MSSLKIDLPQPCYELKTVLINPKHLEWGNTPPLGIAYMAAVLEENNIPVEVIDMSALRMDFVQLRRELERCNADIVGITATTPQVPVAWEIAKIVKELNPNCRVVLGGSHPTALPDESLQKPHVDFVVRGEGEITFLELIRALGNGCGVEDVKGLSFKRGEEIVHNSPRPLIDDLDILPFPARHLFPFPEAYLGVYLKRKVFADIFTSRGCPGNCIFCNKRVFGRSVRGRSPENVVAEIEFLVGKYGVGEIHIADDLFGYDVERALKICDLIIERKLDIVWTASGGLRVDGYTKDLLVKMKQSGCYRIHFGIESGSDEILKKIGKGITSQQARRAIEITSDLGITTVALFMLGNYGENQKTMQETIDFAKSLKADFAQFTMAVPFPGTPFHTILDKRGQLLTKDWTKYEIYDEPIFQTEDLNRDLVVKMYRKAHRSYYFRPSYMMSRLKRMRNWSDVRAALIGGWKIIQRSLTKS